MTSSGIGVVIPCRDGARTLGQALESVLAQRPPPPQVVVVDDGSTDGSAGLARRFGPPVTVVPGDGAGAPRARNLGLARLETPLVHFLDADDWVEGPFHAGAAAVAGADLVVCPLERRGPDGAPLGRDGAAPGLSPRALLESWFSGGQVSTSGLVWDAAFLRRIGGWNAAVRINQDGELVARALLAGARPGWSRQGLAVYRRTGAGTLSADRSAEKVADYVATLARLLAEIEGTAFAPAAPVLQRHLYGVARMAFRLGHVAAGREALAVLRRRGFRGHPGSLPHRLACACLGLERKTRLARSLGAARPR